MLSTSFFVQQIEVAMSQESGLQDALKRTIISATEIPKWYSCPMFKRHPIACRSYSIDDLHFKYKTILYYCMAENSLFKFVCKISPKKKTQKRRGSATNLQDTNLCAIHAKRVTIMPKDPLDTIRGCDSE